MFRDRIRILDGGLNAVLEPGRTTIVQLQPQCLFRAERLWISECFGVTLDNVKIGNASQSWEPVSTLFYSVPSNPKTIDQIRSLIVALKGREPAYSDLVVWDDKTDPEAVLGLPVKWDTCEIGNMISLFFTNKGTEPVTILGVIRGTAAY